MMYQVEKERPVMMGLVFSGLFISSIFAASFILLVCHIITSPMAFVILLILEMSGSLALCATAAKSLIKSRAALIGSIWLAVGALILLLFFGSQITASYMAANAQEVDSHSSEGWASLSAGMLTGYLFLIIIGTCIYLIVYAVLTTIIAGRSLKKPVYQNWDRVETSRAI